MNCLPVPHLAFIFDFSGRHLLFQIHICGVKCTERLFTTVLRDRQLLSQKLDRGLASVSVLGLLCSANREAGLCQRRNGPAGGEADGKPQDQASQTLWSGPGTWAGLEGWQALRALRRLSSATARVASVSVPWEGGARSDLRVSTLGGGARGLTSGSVPREGGACSLTSGSVPWEEGRVV